MLALQKFGMEYCVSLRKGMEIRCREEIPELDQSVRTYLEWGFDWLRLKLYVRTYLRLTCTW